MKKYNKKNILIFLSISIFCFIVISPEHKKLRVGESRNSLQKDFTQKKDASKAKKKSPSRAIASIPSVSPTIKSLASKKRVLLGHIDKPYIVTNKINKNWESLYKKSFFRTVKPELVKDFSIKKKKSVIYIKDGRAKNLEHILVSFTKTGGLRYSFEAYINSETGIMYNSWNQTRFEHNEEPLLDPTNRAYKE